MVRSRFPRAGLGFYGRLAPLSTASHLPLAGAWGAAGFAADAKGVFGSRLIERSLALELAGEVKITYDPAGVVCEVCAPLLL